MAARQLTLWLLRLESTAVQVSRALDAAGVRHLLLKGPVTNAWLYGGPDARPYSDVDMLVGPGDQVAADGVLAGLGFHDVHRSALGAYRPDNERAWLRGDVAVDLHTRLAGVPAELDEAVFDLLFDASDELVLHGHRLRTLDEVARCLHLALHVAQSGRDDRAEQELLLGLQVVAEPVWLAAVELARLTGTAAAARAGLQRVHGADARASALVERLQAVPTTARSRVECRLRQSSLSAELLALHGVVWPPAGRPRAQTAGWFRRAGPSGLPGVTEVRHRARLLQRLGVALLLYPALVVRAIFARDRLNPRP